MERWKNDVANWLQVWEPLDGAICLRNVQEKPSKSLPWLSPKPKKEDKVLKTSKAPLWSPPIPSDIGLKCITMNYEIKENSRASGSYGLTILQQQDG